MSVVDKVSIHGQLYHVLSPSIIGNYLETIGEGCKNPSGYSNGAIFLGYDDDIQYLYKATTTITYGETITDGVNCAKKTLYQILATGDMYAADYDSDNSVKDAGGIADYVEGQIEALDVSDSAVSGSYVTEVSETDGKIAVTREAADAAPTDSSTKMVTSGGVYTALSSKAAQSTISDAYNSSTAYAVGDHFIYNDVIYTVNVACTGITPPNANYYTANNLTDLIEANSSQISDLTTSLTVEDISSTFMSSSSLGSVVTLGTSVHKIGKHIIGDVTFAFDSAMGTATVNLARLTYIPVNDLAYNCFASTSRYGTTAWTPIFINILSTNGTIQVRDYLGGTETYLHFHLDYITS